MIRVCRVMRATSKRLCFMASIARSKRTLSGCLDPTFDSGLLTFLLLHATVMANNNPRTTMTGTLRARRLTMRTSGKLECAGTLARARFGLMRLTLNFE